MREQTQCPSCGQPVADDSVSCSHCGYRLGDRHEGSDQPEPGAPDVEADELQSLGAEATRLHPLAPLVFVLSGAGIGFLAALASSPALGVALGLLGGGLGVWALERGRRLR